MHTGVPPSPTVLWQRKDLCGFLRAWKSAGHMGGNWDPQSIGGTWVPPTWHIPHAQVHRAPGASSLQLRVVLNPQAPQHTPFTTTPRSPAPNTGMSGSRAQPPSPHLPASHRAGSGWLPGHFQVPLHHGSKETARPPRSQRESPLARVGTT